uniref:Uncharacterized protein n=1 Tax=Arundo donax TaxID=35708 RepID=A0A0A9GTF8_ARUDO
MPSQLMHRSPPEYHQTTPGGIHLALPAQLDCYLVWQCLQKLLKLSKKYYLPQH